MGCGAARCSVRSAPACRKVTPIPDRKFLPLLSHSRLDTPLERSKNGWHSSMKKISLAWASWVVIAAVVFNTVGAPLSASTLSPQGQPEHSSPSLLESHTGVDNRLFTKPASSAQEFSLRGEQQSRQLFLLSRMAHVAPYCPTGEDQWRHLSELRAFSFQLFFPRKIAPPSSALDPFLA